MMKTITMIISILWFITFNSCAQKTDVGELLDNSETRSEIFEAIATDQDQMMAFMESIENNEDAMQMMHGNCMMMGKMMKGNNGKRMMMKDSMKMYNMMMKDSMMMHNMMGNMMKNKQMMGNMVQMMNKKGMMTDECMQAMMKSMNEMGMMNQDE